ncbi:MAG: helix-turn-helix domain-containing protein [Marmoricola sp.]
MRALAAGRGITHAEVAEGVGIATSTFERRLTKGGWSAAETVRLAAWFEVPLEDLVTGLGGHLAP